MTDYRVRTKVQTKKGMLDFQEYFVRHKCVPEITDIHLDGIEDALPQEDFERKLKNPDLSALIIGPSNPFVSIDPIIRIPRIRKLMVASNAPVIWSSSIFAVVIASSAISAVLIVSENVVGGLRIAMFTLV